MYLSIPHLEPGTALGGYRIDGVAGQGGMGVVYRATQLGLGRPVALKVIAAQYADNPDFRERFKSEAQVAASIDHPNVVPIFEAGEADGVLYLAMRYVEGTDLRALVDSSQRLDPERAVRIVWQIAGALDAAHRRGLVHRDVKPPNVLIAQGEEEHAYLTDFGLTKSAAASGGVTRTGNFVGTPDFAAPEQIRGEHADARADVYALGAVLFHSLTGRVPFPRNSELAKMYAHLNDPAPAASPLAAGIPAGLDVVIGTAMAKAPEERYASAGDLARAALAALQGEVAPAPAGSVATGDALEQPSRAPDTPAPRPASVAAAFPAAAAPAPAAAPVSAAEAPKPAGPAGWPRRRRIALLLALPSTLLAAGAVAALGAGGVLGGEDEPRGGRPHADRDRHGYRHGGTPAQGRGDDPGRRRPRRHHRRRQGHLRLPREGRDAPADRRGSGRGGRRARPGRGRTRTRSSPARARCGWSTPRATSSSASRASPRCTPTATIPIGNDAQGISLGLQLAWVANTGDDTVQRIDRAQAQTVGDPIGVGDHPIGIFVGSEVWVTNFRDGTLSRIDIATAQVEGRAAPDRRRAPAA